MMEMTPRITMTSAYRFAASGNTGSAMRMMPYAPSFSSTPARMTEPAVGAAVWASGSQVWNGKLGTLMAKAMKKAKNASPDSSVLSANGRSRAASTMSNVPVVK